jgi:hypothetical protein
MMVCVLEASRRGQRQRKVGEIGGPTTTKWPTYMKLWMRY